MKWLTNLVIVTFMVFGLMRPAQSLDLEDKWHTDFGGAFSLTSALGKTVTFEDLKGKLSLVYFGYTSCLMQCPPTWINLAQVADSLGSESEKVGLYFISIDPDRDTVEKISEWQKNWPDIIALRGSRDQTEAVAEAFHIFFAKKPKHAMPFSMLTMKRIRETFGHDKRVDWDAPKGEDFYMMDHTLQSFLLDTDGRYVTHFEMEETPDVIASYIKGHLAR